MCAVPAAPAGGRRVGLGTCWPGNGGAGAGGEGGEGVDVDYAPTATTMYREMEMTYWLEQVEAEMRGLGNEAS